MYAIIATGGKQYKVENGSVLKVEKLEAEVGEKVKLEVLMLNKDGVVTAGEAVKGAVAEAEVVFNGKGPKLHIFTYKAKKNVRKKRGHRQPYTEIKILDILSK